MNCQNGLQAMIICGPSPSLAAVNCEDIGGGSWAPIAVCPDENNDEGGESDSTTTGSYPWAPERHVTQNPSTGAYIIDADFMQSVEDDPNQLTQDDTVLRQSESGHYQVIHAGALAKALGWVDGDLLLAVDGHEITGIADYVEAYAALANRSSHQLKLRRADELLTLDYRVE